MPDYHKLQALCDDVARELEDAERSPHVSTSIALQKAESFAVVLYREIIVAQVMLREQRKETHAS